MIAVSVAIDRSSLSLGALTITNTPASTGLWLEDWAEPGFGFRKRYAPESDVIPGAVLLAAALDVAEIPLTINARAASTVALNTLKAELAAALAQFTYDLTLTVDGVATVYEADCTWPTWVTNPGMANAYMAKTAVVVQVNPPGA